MQESNFDLIVGVHSIKAALNNEDRINKQIFCTQDALTDLKKNKIINKNELAKAELTILKHNEFSKQAEQFYRSLDLKFQRVPSQIFLICSRKPIEEVPWLYQQSDQLENFKILALDQITDIQNAGAIARTASFYGVDALIIPQKGSFGLTPSFYRNASGAAEYLEVVRVTNLARTLTKLQEKGIICLGLSEHADHVIAADELRKIGSLCLVFGKEDSGLSNAVERSINQHMSLESLGDIKSLNVSVAAAIAMEKCWGR